jgi:hypothetical protein
MKSSHPRNGSGVIIQGDGATPPVPVAPREYRQKVLRSIIGINRRKGVSSLSLSELVEQLRDHELRDDVDPKYEPLTLKSIDAAVTDLIKEQELTVKDRTVVFAAPGASTG